VNIFREKGQKTKYAVLHGLCWRTHL